MKSRKAARAMAKYLRQLNPQLAAAMTDERDEVLIMLRQIGLDPFGILALRLVASRASIMLLLIIRSFKAIRHAYYNAQIVSVCSSCSRSCNTSLDKAWAS